VFHASLNKFSLRTLNRVTIQVIRHHVDDIFTATDQALVEFMQFFASRMKIIVEPTDCLSLVTANKIKSQLKGKRVGILLNGENFDINRLSVLRAS
jgi:threonine dehydratase